MGPTFTVNAQQSTQPFSDDFSSDSGQWQYLGSAYRNQTGQNLVLTNSDNEHAGVAFFNAPIQGSFTANFRYKTGGGYCQGDGFTIFFYKQAYSSVNSDSSGNHLGFNSFSVIPGYGIEFDGWQNIPWDFEQVTGGEQNPQGDPSSSHIALIEDFTGNHLTYVDDQRVADNNWHKVTVEVQASSVKVYVDEDLVLQREGALDRTYSGFGFSGSNGGCGSNWHIIDDFSITAQNLKTPTLTTTCISSRSQSAFEVQISGDLTFNGAGVPNAPVLLSYSVTGGDSWQDLTSIHTKSDGSYSALWLLSVTGDYMLKAVYKGSENYLGTTNAISFSIEPCGEQSVFSVTSNSTLNELSFNLANKELSFRVTGDSTTTGYVNVYIPKSLINDISDLKMSLDNNQVDYTVQPLSEGWFLYATYHHSTHLVTINLGSNANPAESNAQSTQAPNTQTQTQELDWVKIAILASMIALAVIVIITALVFMKNQKNKK